MHRKMPHRLAALLLLLATPTAFAHTGLGDPVGLSHGLVHPLAGVDHLLAMVAVGLWAAQRGGRTLWLAPLAFLGLMTLAAALAMAGVALPNVELGIAVSVTVFGLLVLFGRQVAPAVGLALIGGFAVFHGHAHGAEMPLAASGLSYGLGFVLATAALHAGGMLAGLAARACASERVLRYAGAALTGGGFYLIGA